MYIPAQSMLDFKNLSEIEQKIVIIEFAKTFLAKEGRMLSFQDLEAHSLSRGNIRKLFGSLDQIRKLVGAPETRRKPNMTDDELKLYIRSLVQKPNNTLCPSYQKIGTPCFHECTCWVTDKVHLNEEGRPRTWFRDKEQYLSRVVYLLFIGPIKEGMRILHMCDNSSCFMPEHLVQGTDEDNAGHREERGRHGIATKPRMSFHGITKPNDYEGILNWVKANSIISERGEWIYNFRLGTSGYPRMQIDYVEYRLARLILANKLGIPYEKIIIAGHKFPEGSPYAGEKPSRLDVNPDHLYDATAEQNSNDALEYHKGCSLSREQVQFIFDEAKKADFSTISAVEFDTNLAKKLNVSAQIITNARTRKTYKSWHHNDAVVLKKLAVVQLSKQGTYVGRYDSVAEASKSVEGCKAAISNACKGIYKSSGGFIWMYETKFKEKFSTNNNQQLLNEEH